MAKDEPTTMVLTMDEAERMKNAPVNPVANRSIYRNAALLAMVGEVMTLAVILSTWWLMVINKAVFGDPLTNAVVAGVFTLVGAQIALAATFAPKGDQASDGTSFYPNVLLHVSIGVVNACLMLGMGVYGVIAEKVAPEYVIVGTVVGLMFGVIGNVNSLAARFAPKG